MKILIVTGSPHKHGTSNTLAAHFAKGARENGHEVQFYDAARGNLRPCLGCGHCGMAGDCVHKDDGNALLADLLAADAVVFATPVYYFTMSAQLKTVIDRFYARNGAITRKHMKAVLLATAWNNEDAVMNGIESTFDLLVGYLNFIDCGRVLARGSGTVSMMPQKYCEEAEELGRKIGG